MTTIAPPFILILFPVMLLAVSLTLVVFWAEPHETTRNHFGAILNRGRFIRVSKQEQNSHSLNLGMVPIKVLVCTEALCPDCKLFVQQQLTKTYQLLGESIMDLQYVPFGNARINETSKQVICQHGPGECDANLYQECAIALYPETQHYLPFVSCLDRVLPMGYHETTFETQLFEVCAEESGLPFHRIKACHDIPIVAWSLINKAAKATPSYHKYVPWVELDGTPIDVDDGELLITKICAAYKKAGGLDPVCYNLSQGLVEPQVDGDHVMATSQQTV